jgi:hypothetical protein
MFCPKCRAEYREGFYVCADCNLELVHDLPPEEEPEYIEYEEVIGTWNPTDVAFIKSLLDSENITYYFKGEHFAAVRPLLEPAILMVKKDEVEKAENLLSDLNLAVTGINLGNDNDEMENE